MKVIWIGLILYILIQAFFAASRAWKKRQSSAISAKNSTTALEKVASTAQQNQQDQNQQENLDRPVAVESSEDVVQSPEREMVPLRPADLDVRPMAEPASVIEQPIPLETEANVPLAVSLTVNDLVNPEASETTVPNFIPTAPEVRDIQQHIQQGTNEKQDVDDRPDVIEEIAQLEQTGSEDLFSHVLKSLDHPDSTVRVAAVFELGELAAKHQGQANQPLIERLIQLSQDEDTDVRSQAIAALGKVGVGIPSLMSDT